LTVFQDILAWVVILESVPNLLKLRLVNQSFNRDILYNIAHHRLDDIDKLQSWYTARKNDGQSFALRILLQHAKKEDAFGKEIISSIHQTTDLLVQLYETRLYRKAVARSEALEQVCSTVVQNLGLGQVIGSLQHNFSKALKPPPTQCALVVAASRADDELLNYLLKEQDLDVNREAGYFGPPFLAAVRGYHVESARLLLDAGADPNAHYGGKDEATALHVAVDDWAMVKLLLEEKYKLNLQPELLWSCLRKALVSRQVETSRAILQHHFPTLAWHDWNRLGKEMLWLSASIGLDEVVGYLLDYGVNVDEPNGFMTPLTLAARGGYVSTVRLLLARGASREEQYASPNDPFIAAAELGHTKVLEALLENGMDPNGSYRRRAFGVAAGYGQLEVNKLMVEHGFDLHSDYARDVLLSAINRSQLDVVKWLVIDCGMSLDGQDVWPDGGPLVRAVQSEKPEIVRLLLELGVNTHEALTRPPATPGEQQMVELVKQLSVA
jgi:uncharacterized protein